MEDLKVHADPNVVICLAGNKCDKLNTFDLKICEEYAANIGAIFFKTSALTGAGVNEVFKNISVRAVEIYKKESSPKEPENKISLNQTQNENNSTSCC